MSIHCRTAGVHVQVDATDAHWLHIVREACAGQEAPTTRPDVHVSVNQSSGPFDLRGYRPLTRGAWAGRQSVVLVDACGSGVDLEVMPTDMELRVIAHPHPTWRHRLLGAAAPDRQVLLQRAAVIQYPALWWAGVKGLVPLHVSAALAAGQGVLVAGPGGVGKSTLMASIDRPDRPVSDNLCVADAANVHGVLEPARGETGSGRRMPHGRREMPWADRLESVAVERILVLRRGIQSEPIVRRLDTATTSRELTAGTYAAGELRRYWAFAATLALGTGMGPAHPPVSAAADELARAIPACEVVLPSPRGTTLRSILAKADIALDAEPAGASEQ
jgi:hypothetical protein